ncbi:hypothetical protein PCE1_000503 [Barthelona sp. PCE]
MIEVLMVAEKPSVAQSIAAALAPNGNYECTGHSLRTYTYEGKFLNKRAMFRVTAVTGHIFGCDFPGQFNNRKTVEPFELFDAPTTRILQDNSGNVIRNLQNNAKHCSYLVLFLDCDREGENINFEVMDVCLPKMRRMPNEQQVYRARFFSLVPGEIRKAMNNLVEPNRNEALAVDARQILDLKLGCAMTRFLTRYLQMRYANLPRTISYGPCQIPCLGFVVQRNNIISKFKPEKYWKMKSSINVLGSSLAIQWQRGRIFNQHVITMFTNLLKERPLTVTSVNSNIVSRSRPLPLNTVALLMNASNAIGLGPQDTMNIANRLYLSGYTSYPRTESTAFSSAFPHKQHVRSLTEGFIADKARTVLRDLRDPPKGLNCGDHPPIHPVHAPRAGELSGIEMRVYDLIASYYLASLYKPMKTRRVTISLECELENGQVEKFKTVATSVVDGGWHSIVYGSRGIEWDKEDEDGYEEEEEETVDIDAIESIQKGNRYSFEDIGIEMAETKPPGNITEAQLIRLMEKNGIGTDASIATHIQAIQNRNYVHLGSGRTLVPTRLGLCLIHAFLKIDPELCLPKVRSSIEGSVTEIANGNASFEDVVTVCIEQFKRKYNYFVEKIDLLQTLFGDVFDSITTATTSKAIARCPTCMRSLMLVRTRPMRIMCSTCQTEFDVPEGVAKISEGIRDCPICEYPILTLTFNNKSKRSYCCHCYTHPPPAEMFENQDVEDFEDGKNMHCSECPHPICPHASASLAPCPMVECEGEMIVDPVLPRIICSYCGFGFKINKYKKILGNHKECEKCECGLVNAKRQDDTIERDICPICDLSSELEEENLGMYKRKKYKRKPYDPTKPRKRRGRKRRR